MRLLVVLCVVCGCGSDDHARHIVDSGSNTVAGALDGLRWELPCIADEGGNVCTANTAAPQTATITGSGHYNVTLRFRGVIEQRTYTGGTVADSYFVTDADTPNTGDTFNIYALTVSSPAHVYYVNDGTSNIYNAFAIDYMETIPLDGGATATLTADPVNGAEIENLDPNNTPIVVPDIAPAPAAFNGQFVQMDVISVSGS